MGEQASAHKPLHIAIIMDGNGRWAKARGLPRSAGHERGVEAVKSTVESCITHGIPVLTLFAFGRENWRRPAQEVKFLFDLFFSTVQSQMDDLIARGVALRFVGDRSAFSEKMQALMATAEERSKHNTKLHLNLAMNYSGQWDVAQACTRILAAKEQGIETGAIDENMLARYLSMADLPDPDLFIRTSGEIRISNFILFQLAYTELFFTPIAWPDFTPAIFQEALDAYASRERRFGATSPPLRDKTHA